MHDLTWESTKRVPNVTPPVEILRRPLTLDQDELLLDLEPAFHVRSLIELRSRGATRRINGTLSSLALVANTLTVVVNAVPQQVSLSAANIGLAALTVWRVGDALDALQFLLEGNTASLYIQVGPRALVHVLAAADADAENLILRYFASGGGLLRDA